MLFKLSISGIRNRVKDYVVLLTGLMMSSAIFYMLANMATNKEFLQANLSFKYVSVVCIFGLILLGLITFVYIMYANMFLLSMREHDYGLFMMLGAKKSKIGQLIFIETFILGTVATLIGIIVGMGLAKFLAGFLMQLLGLKIPHFSVVYLPAVIDTLLLYVGIFLVASLFNTQRLLRTNVLALLHSNEQADTLTVRPVLSVLQSTVGFAFLGVGYWSLADIAMLRSFAIPLALITIVIGSYLLFKSVILVTLQWFKKRQLATKGLRNFTASQIMFRVHDYTKILTITSLLFAMALGAITVGIGYHRQIPIVAKTSSAYTMVINNPTSAETKKIDSMATQYRATYSQKKIGGKIYYDTKEFQKKPFQFVRATSPAKLNQATYYSGSLQKTKRQANDALDFQGLSGTIEPLTAVFVDHDGFQNLDAKTQRVTVFRVADLNRYQQILTSLNANQTKRYPATAELSLGQFQMFQFSNSVFGGLEFVGFFLGIGFLAMLASALMFKILSGASADVNRYHTLSMIGSRRGLMRASIRNEILVFFTLPGGLGIVDVLFGLKMFGSVMQDPYYMLDVPIAIFLALYAFYFVITTVIYQRVVLPKKQH